MRIEDVIDNSLSCKFIIYLPAIFLHSADSLTVRNAIWPWDSHHIVELVIVINLAMLKSRRVPLVKAHALSVSFLDCTNRKLDQFVAVLRYIWRC